MLQKTLYSHWLIRPWQDDKQSLTYLTLLPRNRLPLPVLVAFPVLVSVVLAVGRRLLGVEAVFPVLREADNYAGLISLICVYNGHGDCGLSECCCECHETV